MLVVADTSPLNYLIQLGCIDVLPRLYQRIVVPSEVIAELRQHGAPQPVTEWIDSLPAWIEVASPTGQPRNFGLDDGETAAILLAIQLKADRLLIDERDGRRIAVVQFGLKVAGTLAVLVDADSAGLIDLREKILALKQTSFRASSQLLRETLIRAGYDGEF